MSQFVRSFTKKIKSHLEFAGDKKHFAGMDLSGYRPEFRAIEREVERARSILAHHHKYYSSNISTGGAAASLELSALIYACCIAISAKRVVDLGSGFTSFVLRQFQSHSTNPVEVWSVDNDEHWLAATGEYLQEHGLSCDNLLLWDDFTKKFDSLAPLDLVVLDVRPISRRIEWLPRLLGSLSAGGVIIADDMHKLHMRRPILEVSRDAGAACVDCSRLTKDSYGRFAAAIFPGKAPEIRKASS